MTWHAPEESLERYASGEASAAEAYSLEAHVIACPGCRAAVAARFPAGPLERVWSDVAARVDSLAPGPVERALRALGAPDHVARLLAATPSLSVSWFAAVGVALAFAVAAARAGQQGRILFLVIAPLVPLAGVAAAYGPGVDPTYEVGLAAPMRSYRLLFIRAVAVASTGIVLAGVAALALPHLDWTAAAWLLPALSLSAASLALSSAWGPLAAFGGVAAAWVMGVVLTEALSSVPFAMFRAPEQVAFLMLTVVCLAATAARREAFDVRSSG